MGATINTGAILISPRHIQKGLNQKKADVPQD
jgi:hypothetical protein